MKTMTRRLQGLAAASMLTGLFVFLSHAQDTETKQLQINVTPGEPPSCSLTCSPGNLRNSGGQLTIDWESNGDVVDVVAQPVTGSHPGPHDIPQEDHALTGKPPTAAGSLHVHQFDYSKFNGWGYKFRYDATCRWNAGGVSATASCTATLSCFPKGTKILKCDGTEANIEDLVRAVEKGELVEVQTWDPASVEDPQRPAFRCTRVTEGVRTNSNRLFKVYTSTSGRVLEITPAHQMWINGGWKDSSDLRVGDRIMDANGNEVVVTRKEEVEGTVQVFNLITDYPHDFFANSYLVHNDNPGESHAGKGLVAGTRVIRADGRQVPIETVKAGDKLMAVDSKTGKRMITVVRKAFSQKLNKTVVVNGLRMGPRHQIVRVKPQAAGKKGR